MLKALLVAGSPEPSSPELVARLAGEADVVIAVDRGADACLSAGVTPGFFCGDADTVSADALSWVRGVDSGVRLFNPHKDDTDLSLALSCARSIAEARKCGGLEVTVTCASGGRPDHALAVFGVLAGVSELRPRLVEDGFECRVLSPDGCDSWDLGERAKGCEFSFVPLHDGCVVSESGMRWCLDHHRIDALCDLGISNVVEAPDARITCHGGCVAAFLLG